MLALTIAILTGTLAVIGKVLSEFWARYLDRRAIAGAIAGEIRAYFEIVDRGNVAQSYRAIAQLDDGKLRQILMSFPRTILKGSPVYDKLSDKLGIIPSAYVFEISRIYNILEGARLLIADLPNMAAPEIPEDLRKRRLLNLAGGIDDGIMSAKKIASDLETLSHQSFMDYAREQYRAFVGKRPTSPNA
jgi:hypothetical protein